MPSSLADFDVTTASPARMYQEALGGKDNFPADRAANDLLYEAVGERLVRLTATENDNFRKRITSWLATERLGQYIDVGCGLPLRPEVYTHALARKHVPAASVVYVDADPIVISHARATVADAQTAVIAADAREPASIVDAPELRRLVNFAEPVALLLVAILHFIPDAADPAGIIASLCAPCAPGSRLVLSHFCSDGHSRTAVAGWLKGFENASAPLVFRTRAEIASLCPAGWQWEPPGLSRPAEWGVSRDLPARSSEWLLAGVARRL